MTDTSTEQFYIAKYDFKGSDTMSQLSFPRGALLLCRPGKPEEAWWLGSLYYNENNQQQRSRLGWFPSTYVAPYQAPKQQEPAKQINQKKNSATTTSYFTSDASADEKSNSSNSLFNVTNQKENVDISINSSSQAQQQQPSSQQKKFGFDDDDPFAGLEPDAEAKNVGSFANENLFAGVGAQDISAQPSLKQEETEEEPANGFGDFSNVESSQHEKEERNEFDAFRGLNDHKGAADNFGDFSSTTPHISDQTNTSAENAQKTYEREQQPSHLDNDDLNLQKDGLKQQEHVTKETFFNDDTNLHTKAQSSIENNQLHLGITIAKEPQSIKASTTDTSMDDPFKGLENSTSQINPQPSIGFGFEANTFAHEKEIDILDNMPDLKSNTLSDPLKKNDSYDDPFSHLQQVSNINTNTLSLSQGTDNDNQKQNPNVLLTSTSDQVALPISSPQPINSFFDEIPVETQPIDLYNGESKGIVHDYKMDEIKNSANNNKDSLSEFKDFSEANQISDLNVTTHETNDKEQTSKVENNLVLGNEETDDFGDFNSHVVTIEEPSPPISDMKEDQMEDKKSLFTSNDTSLLSTTYEEKNFEKTDEITPQETLFPSLNPSISHFNQANSTVVNDDDPFAGLDLDPTSGHQAEGLTGFPIFNNSSLTKEEPAIDLMQEVKEEENNGIDENENKDDFPVITFGNLSISAANFVKSDIQPSSSEIKVSSLEPNLSSSLNNDIAPPQEEEFATFESAPESSIVTSYNETPKDDDFEFSAFGDFNSHANTDAPKNHPPSNDFTFQENQSDLQQSKIVDSSLFESKPTSNIDENFFPEDTAFQTAPNNAFDASINLQKIEKPAPVTVADDDDGLFSDFTASNTNNNSTLHQQKEQQVDLFSMDLLSSPTISTSQPISSSVKGNDLSLFESSSNMIQSYDFGAFGDFESAEKDEKEKEKETDEKGFNTDGFTEFNGFPGNKEDSSDNNRNTELSSNIIKKETKFEDDDDFGDFAAFDSAPIAESEADSLAKGKTSCETNENIVEIENGSQQKKK